MSFQELHAHCISFAFNFPRHWRAQTIVVVLMSVRRGEVTFSTYAFVVNKKRVHQVQLSCIYRAQPDGCNSAMYTRAHLHISFTARRRIARCHFMNASGILRPAGWTFRVKIPKNTALRVFVRGREISAICVRLFRFSRPLILAVV